MSEQGLAELHSQNVDAISVVDLPKSDKGKWELLYYLLKYDTWAWRECP